MLGDIRGAVRAAIRYRCCRAAAAARQVPSRRVVTTVGQILCYREKSSKGAAKSRADAARGTGAKIQGLSALPGTMLLCTQASIFSSMVTCGLQPRLRHRKLWSTAESRRGILIEGRGSAPIALLWRSE